MEELLEKIIVASNIEEEDKEEFTQQFYKSIGEYVKKQMVLNKDVKKLDLALKEEIAKKKSLYDEIQKCNDIIKDENAVKAKVKALGLRYNLAKNKIPTVVHDPNFAAIWINIKEAKEKLTNLRINTTYPSNFSDEPILSLKSASFYDDNIKPIEDIDTWNIMYMKIPTPITFKFNTFKQLENLGWSVKYTTHRVESNICYGWEEGVDKVEYLTYYIITLKPNE